MIRSSIPASGRERIQGLMSAAKPRRQPGERLLSRSKTGVQAVDDGVPEATAIGLADHVDVGGSCFRATNPFSDL